MTKKILVYTDGGARGNPGPAAIGAVILTENLQKLASIFRKIGQTTNNVAEYTAVIEALKWIKENINKNQGEEILKQFLLDSELVVNQLNGYFKVKDPELRNLLLQVRMLEQEIGGNVSYKHIPREQNREADRLVNMALDEI